MIVKYSLWQIKNETFISAVFLVVALWTRLHRLSDPDIVTWDEAHFGKFAGFYVKREFFFDVHPPLGKMLLGLMAYLAGFDGKFDFDSGVKYPDDVPYVKIRFACSIISALTIPIMYLAARSFKFSQPASILVASMILLDLSFVSLGRLILLDGLLLFGTALSVYSLATFRAEHTHPFTIRWWFWLTATGISLGLTSSIKWVGLFVTALVGLFTIADLWVLLGQHTVSLTKFCQHFLARALCLIVIPIMVYMAVFAFHFGILTNSGPGDAVMPSLFQAGLNGSTLGTHPGKIAYGSFLSIRNNAYNGALLHSHVQTYPSGSKQQQITCYPHHDSNNYWMIVKASTRKYFPEDDIEFVQDQDIVILRHNATSANLHSHPIPAPKTIRDYEVSGYGTSEWGDANDHWKVEVVDDLLPTNDFGTIRALTTRFRLRHVNTGCFLYSHSVVLPDWGFKQQEVTCRQTEKNNDHTIWNVEEHINSKLPNSKSIPIKYPFLKAFVHLNAAMFYANEALTSDPNKIDDLSSHASSWPLLFRGIRMTAWGEDSTRVYMLGNPLVWWGGIIALFIWISAVLLHQIHASRLSFNYSKTLFSTSVDWNEFVVVGLVIFGGWLLEYVPYWVMGRVTYLHHYLPSVLFLALMAGLISDYLTAVTVVFVSSCAFWLKQILSYASLSSTSPVSALSLPSLPQASSSSSSLSSVQPASASTSDSQHSPSNGSNLIRRRNRNEKSLSSDIDNDNDANRSSTPIASSSSSSLLTATPTTASASFSLLHEPSSTSSTQSSPSVNFFLFASSSPSSPSSSSTTSTSSASASASASASSSSPYRRAIYGLSLAHVAFLYLFLIVVTFAHFYPLPYGMTGPVQRFAHLQWRPSWHLA